MSIQPPEPTSDDLTRVSPAKSDAVADAIDVSPRLLASARHHSAAINDRVAAAPDTNLTALRRLVLAYAQGELPQLLASEVRDG